MEKLVTSQEISKFNSDRDFLIDEQRHFDQHMTNDTETNANNSILGSIQEQSDFSRLFFSKKNLEWIDKNIRYGVYQKTGYRLAKQDETNLLIVMKSFYLQYSNNPNNPGIFKNELLRLNNMIISDYTPKIVSEAKQYVRYLQDIKRNAEPIRLPINSSIKGTTVSQRGPADVLGIKTLL